MKTLEFHSLNVKKYLSNVLITGKSNFDEKKWATGQSYICKEITSYRIGTLDVLPSESTLQRTCMNPGVNRVWLVFLSHYYLSLQQK
jgi:hypothetical protein